MSTASYRGPQTGLWIGDEDPCIFRQCSKVAVQHGSHGDDHGTSGDSSSSSGSSGGGGGGGGGSSSTVMTVNDTDCAWHILTHQFGSGAPGEDGRPDPEVLIIMLANTRTVFDCLTPPVSCQ